MERTNNKNFVIFLVLTFVLLIGWMELQRWLSPKPKEPADKPDAAQVDPKPKEQPKALRPETESPAEQIVRAAQVVSRVAGHAARPRSQGQPIVLGTDSDNLRALLDPLGASLRGVWLNKFQQVDRLGKPEWLEADGKRVPKPLELVREDLNRESGSYLLLHLDPKRKGTEFEYDPLPTLGEIEWEVVEPQKVETGQVYRKVAFATEIEGVRITKTFTLESDDYHIGLEVKLELLADAPGGAKPFPYQITSSHGVRIEGEWYASVLRNALIGWKDTRRDVFLRTLHEARTVSFQLGSKSEQSDGGDKQIRYLGVVVQYFASLLVVDDRQENQGILARARATLEGAAMKGTVKSIDRQADKFVLVGLDKAEYEFYLGPRTSWPFNFDEGSRLAVVFTFDEHNRRVVTEFRAEEDTEPLFFNDIMARATTAPVELKPGVPVVHKYLLYNGPVKVRLLGQLEGAKAVPDELVERYEHTLGLNTLTDYPSPGWFGDFSNKIYFTEILIKVTNLMHGVLWALHTYIMPWSWGLCIIMLTVLVRGMMFPVSRKQALTSIKMQELAPELRKLQEKYKGDRQAMGMAQMELYRKHGVNPLGTCWLLLLQMPIFLGLYYALQESIHFRLAPFWPWISNLGAPDMLFWWSEQVPWISRPSDYGSFLYLGPFFNLLPVVAVALMIAQQHLMTPPALDEQQAMQMKMMKYMMVIFGLMFYKVAAGLCIYFIASSLWGFAERKLLPKRKPESGAASAAPGQGGLLQRLREKVENLRPAPDATTAGGASGNGPARSEAVTSGVPGAGQRRRGKKRRKAGRDGGPAPAADPASAPEADGARGKGRSWWAGLREWWADLLEQARKK